VGVGVGVGVGTDPPYSLCIIPKSRILTTPSSLTSPAIFFAP